MKFSNIAASVALAGILMTNALDAPASGRPLGGQSFGPIQIDGCAVGRSGDATRGLTIVYHNTRRVAADRVVFSVDYRGLTRLITDAGTFSQYASINHGFDVFDGFGFEGPVPNRCVVTYVHFTSGEVWRR